MGQPVTYVNPPDECDICQLPFGSVMYDIKTNSGPWGNLCESCMKIHSSGHLGLGQGQKYELQEGKWVKTAG